jgi:hypothetical protein
MPPSQSPTIRARRLKRRFSSASANRSWLAPDLAHGARGRPREISSSPAPSTATEFYSRRTDYSEFEVESDPESTASQDHHSTRSPPRPLIYASLPPTPISPSPPLPEYGHVSTPELPPIFPPSPRSYQAPFSLWDYLREELLATDFDSHQELKWERVSNFLSIPLAMEKVRYNFIHGPLVSKQFADNRVRVYTLSGLIPLHIHHSADPIHSRILSFLLQHLTFAVFVVRHPSTPAKPKSRHPTHDAPRSFNCHSDPPH